MPATQRCTLLERGTLSIWVLDTVLEAFIYRRAPCRYYNANATDDDLSSEDYLSAGRPAHRRAPLLRTAAQSLQA